MLRRATGVAVVTALVGVIATTAVMGQVITADPYEVVKSTDPQLSGLIAEAHERSATFRRLVHDIRASQWIVFVQAGPCPDKAAIACLLHFVGTYDGSRYMRVVLDYKRRHPDTVIGMLAHELQHVLEVAQEPDVTDQNAIRVLFRTIGRISVQSSTVTAYETDAARLIGERVLAELSRAARHRGGAPPSVPSTILTTRRVRAVGAHASRLLVEGSCMSATFRDLLARLNESDLIVHIVPHQFEMSSLTGALQYVTTTETDRILRVLLRPLLSSSVGRRQAIATLGHELQHAVEIADAPAVGTQVAFEAFYRQHGSPGRISGAHDTQKARDVESRIFAELRSDAPGCPLNHPD